MVGQRLWQENPNQPFCIKLNSCLSSQFSILAIVAIVIVANAQQCHEFVRFATHFQIQQCGQWNLGETQCNGGSSFSCYVITLCCSTIHCIVLHCRCIALVWLAMNYWWNPMQWRLWAVLSFSRSVSAEALHGFTLKLWINPRARPTAIYRTKDPKFWTQFFSNLPKYCSEKSHQSFS